MSIWINYVHPWIEVFYYVVYILAGTLLHVLCTLCVYVSSVCIGLLVTIYSLDDGRQRGHDDAWLVKRINTLCFVAPNIFIALYAQKHQQHMFLSKWKWIKIHSDNILLYMYRYIYVTESIFNWFNIQIIYWKWALLPPVFEPTLSQLSHYKTGAQIGVLQWMDEVAKCVATI